MNVAEEHRQCKFNSSDPQIRIGGSLFKKAEGLRVENFKRNVPLNSNNKENRYDYQVLPDM